MSTLKRPWQRFVDAARKPRQAQEARLRCLVGLGARSEFGHLHGLNKVDSYRSFCDRVPIRSYEEFAPWIERICAGEKAVLSSGQVTMVELSGGTSLTNKVIPYTRSLLEEFEAATNPWIFNLFSSFDGLKGTTSYWSISPAMACRQTTTGGLPIGFSDDTEYFGPLRRLALHTMMAVPAEVGRICDTQQWRLSTLKHLLEAEDLGFISVWSPTFLSLLMESLEANLDTLLGELSKARAATVRSAVELSGQAPSFERIWPRLKVISCWTDGWAKSHVGALRRWFPTTVLQPKGLLATEGVVSFPIAGHTGSVVAVAGHFLEFIDLDHPSALPLLADELRQGGSYSPVLTTGGGLYRYHLKDIVRCVGTYLNTPLIQFEGKLDNVSDRFGEKLSARQVEDAFARARTECSLSDRFAVLSPTEHPIPHYRLFVDTDAEESVIARAVAILERELRNSHHYDYCRKLAQLGPLQAARVQNGCATFSRTAIDQGRRAGSLKPSLLDLHGIAGEAFPDARAIELERALI
ncbi:MAG: GH3 auxin-responsive promoter family protein [Myxococcota bacterium]|nr:GH3 auxin-responsive promoter family protein [Myxococcota bacterium]